MKGSQFGWMLLCLALTSGCQSTFAFLAGQSEKLLTPGRTDELEVSGTVTLPKGLPELPTLTVTDPLAGIPLVSGTQPLATASALTSSSGYRILDDVGLPTVLSDNQVANTLVQIVDPASGRVLQEETSDSAGEFSMLISKDSASKGLIVETVLQGPLGPIGYLASPLQIPSSRIATIDLDIGTTACVYTGMDLAGMNQTFELATLSTRKSTVLEKILARIDTSQAIAAADTAIVAYGANQTGDWGSMVAAATGASTELATLTWQGYLRFGSQPPARISQEALLAAFMDRIDQQVLALQDDTEGNLNNAAAAAVSSATYQGILSAAASADAAAGSS